MRIDIVTVFPETIAAALDYSIVKRARERGIVTINVIDLREFTSDRHRTTDDIPYGGGGGMVMKVEPIALAVDALTGRSRSNDDDAGTPDNSESVVREETAQRVVLTDPRGPVFTQETARRWAHDTHIILICGHYEGVDERVRRYVATDEVSIGDYILTGGELPALVVTDALVRLQPGALGDNQAPDKDTFSENLLEYPHYTRPREFRGRTVPDVLFGGHHANIEKWRRKRQLLETRRRRPDLFAALELSKSDLKLIAEPESDAGGPSDDVDDNS